MAKYYCLEKHETAEQAPVMMFCGMNKMGNNYICLKCQALRMINQGKILQLPSPSDNKPGLVSSKDGRINFKFNFKDQDKDFKDQGKVFVNMEVTYEVKHYLDDDGRKSETAIISSK